MGRIESTSFLLLLLVVTTTLTPHVGATLVNEICSQSYLYYPDGTRAKGSSDWSGSFFAKGPCLAVTGTGITETYLKSLLVIDGIDVSHRLNLSSIVGSIEAGLGAIAPKLGVNVSGLGATASGLAASASGLVASASQLGAFVPRVVTFASSQGASASTFQASPLAVEIKMYTWAKRQRQLAIHSNALYSTGQHAADGRFFSIGGATAVDGLADGGASIRAFKPCTNDKCEFSIPSSMVQKRSFSTAQLLPDGRLMIVGGSTRPAVKDGLFINVPSVEYYPRKRWEKDHPLPFLSSTLPFNLYPFVHLLPNGLVFIFAGNQYTFWNTQDSSEVLGNYPILGSMTDGFDGMQHLYPLSGTSAMLPLSWEDGYSPEIMICGGASPAALKSANVTAAVNCWGIRPLDGQPFWVSQPMRYPRVMPMSVLLPDGTLFIHGGAKTGYAGTPLEPLQGVLEPELYNTRTHSWLRGDLGLSRVPRGLGASALLLHDGSVFVSGGGPHEQAPKQPKAHGGPAGADSIDHLPEFRSEFFFPPYFQSSLGAPHIIKAPRKISVGSNFSLIFATPWRQEMEVQDGGFRGFFLSFNGTQGQHKVDIVLAHPGFSTHGSNHGMRNVNLQYYNVKKVPGRHGVLEALVAAPPNKNISPPTWYWLFVLVGGVPNHDGRYAFIV